MATISGVAPGARLRRRKNSTRGLSSAFCSLARLASEGCVEVRLRRVGDALGIGAHLRGEEGEEAQPLRRIEPRIAVEQLARDGDAGGLAAAGDERPRQLLDVLPRVGAEQRLGQQRAALLGDRAQQLLKKRNVQGAVLPPCDEATIARLSLLGTAARRHMPRPAG